MWNSNPTWIMMKARAAIVRARMGTAKASYRSPISGGNTCDPIRPRISSPE